MTQVADLPPNQILLLGILAEKDTYLHSENIHNLLFGVVAAPTSEGRSAIADVFNGIWALTPLGLATQSPIDPHLFRVTAKGLEAWDDYKRSVATPKTNRYEAITQRSL